MRRGGEERRVVGVYEGGCEGIKGQETKGEKMEREQDEVKERKRKEG